MYTEIHIDYKSSFFEDRLCMKNIIHKIILYTNCIPTSSFLYGQQKSDIFESNYMYFGAIKNNTAVF